MAVERIKNQLDLNLSEIVIGRFNMFKELRRDIQVRLESEFAQRVMDEDLDYRQQMRVRQEMVKTETARKFPDVAYIKEIRGDIFNIRKLVKFQQVRGEYLESWTSYKSGSVSIDRYLAKIEGQLSRTTDDTLRAEIQEQISQARVDKRKAEKNILNNRVVFAKDDGSEDLLNTVLGELKISRASEAAKGNEERVSFIDTKISSINKQLSEAMIGRNLADVEFDVLKSGANPAQKLKSLNVQIEFSDITSPVTIGGVRYDSAQQYWTLKRNAYLAGEGIGLFDDFFGELTEKFENEINSSSNVNEFGRVPSLVIDNMLNDYSAFEALPYMVPFKERLSNNRNGVVNSAIKKSADAILIAAKARLDWTDVDTSLTELEQRYAIELSSYRAQASIDRGVTEGGRVAGVMNTARAVLIQQRIDPNAPENFNLLVEETNKLLAEGGFTTPEPTPAERTREELGGKEVPAEKVPEEIAPPAKVPAEETPPVEKKEPTTISAASTIEEVEAFLETKLGAPISFKGDPTQFIRQPGKERFNLLRGLRTQEELQRATIEKTVQQGVVELPKELKNLFEIGSPFFT